MVLSGIISKSSKKALEKTPQQDLAKAILSKNITRLIFVILISAIWLLVLLKFGMQAIIDFFSNMFVAISMWSSAKNAANIFVNETMVAQAYERIELLSEYMQWNKGDKEGRNMPTKSGGGKQEQFDTKTGQYIESGKSIDKEDLDVKNFKDKISQFKASNANSGYSGYSMSNRAVMAYESGEMPLSNWSKEDILDNVESYIKQK